MRVHPLVPAGPIVPALLVSLVAASGPPSGPPSGPSQAAPAAPVEVAAVVEKDLAPAALLLGVTEPRRRSVVAAAIEGYVIAYPVEEGQRVAEGDVLTRLRDDILRLELAEAEAALAEVLELHRRAKLDLERARQLAAKDAVTQKALDDAVTAERTLALRVPQAEARAGVLKANIAKKTVTAPFAGQVVREHTEVGEWVARGGPVATVVDITSVFVRVNVPENSIRFVHERQKVPLIVEAAGEGAFEGTVVSVADEGDPHAKTFPIRVEVLNDGRLRAGMSARVELAAGSARTALVVPKDAILRRGGESFVFVAGKENTAQLLKVRVGASTGGDVEVLEGLSVGEKVVVKGNERLRDGAALRILAAKPEARGEE